MAENTENKAANTSANSTGNAGGTGKSSGNAATNAAANKTSLFREKNLERLESPEKLNDYLRVTSPGVWMVLGAVIVLLIGVCIWGFFGRIQATTQAVVITKSGESSCLVPQSALEGVLKYRTIEINEEKRELVPDILEPQVISESTNVYVMLAGGLRVGDIVYPISLSQPLESDGFVTGSLVTEILSPLSLLFN